MRGALLGAMVLLLLAVGTACGGNGDDAEDAGGASASTAVGGADSSSDGSGANASGSRVQTPAAAASGGAGTLTLGNDTLELDRARCFLQEQEAAGGGGKILFTAQGFGTTSDGTDFVVDISRYDEDSQFTGDHILVDVGDPRGEDFYSWEVRPELEIIEQTGSTLRGEGLTFRHSEDGSEIPGAFEVNC